MSAWVSARAHVKLAALPRSRQCRAPSEKAICNSIRNPRLPPTDLMAAAGGAASPAPADAASPAARRAVDGPAARGARRTITQTLHELKQQGR